MLKILNKLRKENTPEELAEKKFKKIKLKDTDIAIDCGANVGDFTYHLSKSKATVYAFEPNPYAFGALIYRMRDRKNVQCINKGVLDKNTEMKLYLHNNVDKDPVYWSTSSSILAVSKNINKNSFMLVELIDLCEFIENLDKPVKILKLDIEGAELQVLRKLIETGTISKVENVFVEMHDKWLPDLKEESDEIRKLLEEKEITHVNLDWK